MKKFYIPLAAATLAGCMTPEQKVEMKMQAADILITCKHDNPKADTDPKAYQRAAACILDGAQSRGFNEETISRLRRAKEIADQVADGRYTIEEGNAMLRVYSAAQKEKDGEIADRNAAIGQALVGRPRGCKYFGSVLVCP
jgi:hypothetical protein